MENRKAELSFSMEFMLNDKIEPTYDGQSVSTDPCLMLLIFMKENWSQTLASDVIGVDL